MMAFHVACPITCRRICFCSLGFSRTLQSDKAKDGFQYEVARIEELFRDPWLFRVRDEGTVQVPVPKVAPSPPASAAAPGDGGDAEEMSMQTKRVVLQKRAAAASLVAEDFARRVESGALLDDSKDIAGEDQGQSNVKIMCRLCYVGENEDSSRARKMLPCKSCGKKYHRSCLKSWSQNRDLFHWTSWTCPSCRICEACRRTGDQTKFKFCRRCDAAYHCYCQQPPHKNVSSGPYLCPKHTRCHSCGSTVPGNGLSLRWFLGYTCCDACGRLFVKGNYCPVCLKVYRDSEPTPMVCCDVCERWVHCQCDGISDEKYLQFQVDGNLQYKCPNCRGECYQVRDLEDAVRELWRRRDEADRGLIASLRAAAGLPTQEEIFSISPYSDDEDNVPVTLKSEFGRSLKFSLKGMADKSPKKNKEYGKKFSNTKNAKKKENNASLSSTSEAHKSFRHDFLISSGYTGLEGKSDDDMQLLRRGGHVSSPIGGFTNEGLCSTNQAGVLNHKFIDKDKKSRTIQIKTSKSHGFGIGNGTGKEASLPIITNTKGSKLVIHLGGRNRNATGSPKSDASGHPMEQVLTTINGIEESGQEQMMTCEALGRHAKIGDTVDNSDHIKGPRIKGKESSLIKIKKINSDVPGMNPSSLRNIHDGIGSVSSVNPRLLTGKSGIGESRAMLDAATRNEKVYMRKNIEARTDASVGGNNDTASRPLLKLKFKTPSHGNQSCWAPQGDEEKISSVKGQRSKRKRPSLFMDKMPMEEDGKDLPWFVDNQINEIMDANWILQKLGKDAIGKRVEVHQSSDDTWCRGMVEDFIEGTSIISVALDGGRTQKLELGKQGIRFVCQKQKRSNARG